LLVTATSLAHPAGETIVTKLIDANGAGKNIGTLGLPDTRAG
jgi:hypothetical protein